MAMMDLAMHRFEQKLDQAIARAQVVLDTNRRPVLPSTMHHRYEDKYTLVEGATNAAIASFFNCLAALGLTETHIAQIRAWASSSAVSLQFRSEERCRFEKKATRDVEDPTKRVVEASVGGMVRAALTSKTVTTITEYFWRLEMSYEVCAIRGVGVEPTDRLVIVSRVGEEILKTLSELPPRPEVRIPACNEEVNISVLAKHLFGDGNAPSFKVDRLHSNCRTPRRNPDVDAAFKQFTTLTTWCKHVRVYLDKMMRIQQSETRSLDFSSTSADLILVPVLPVLVEQGVDAPSPSASASAAVRETPGALVLLSSGVLELEGTCQLTFSDTNRLLAEEVRALREKRSALELVFGAGNGFATVSEAMISTTLAHCSDVCLRWGDAIEYIEGLLRKQLIAAIGKEVSPADFAEYMRFHNRKLFAEAYTPSPFCFAVRRSNQHGPEGTVSIEEDIVGSGGDSKIAQPILTIAARSSAEHYMHFQLNASTRLTFGGERYLHAWLSHQFSGESGGKLSLVCRARQFSSMIVLLGRISSASSFEPKYAAIVQNKDELAIPLDLSTIPTPKEFKDAIESLSPEQQSFAKAFRAMQLESTLFGVLVIQIKPQLERVLNLVGDSLTKEIKLTQDLMQLFVKYQIPSDLLSFDASCASGGFGLVDVSPSERLEMVRGHVKAMNDMIQQSKQEELSGRLQEELYRQPLAQPQHALIDALDDCDECECDAVVELQVAESCHRKQYSAIGGMISRVASAAGSGFTKMKRAMPLEESAVSYCMASESAPSDLKCQKEVDRCSQNELVEQSPANAAKTDPAKPSHEQPNHADNIGQAGAVFAPKGQRDYTKVPKELDERFEKLDADSAIRPTIITPGVAWTKKAQKALLAEATTSILGSDDQKEAKDAAFDLLDALTKSGALPIEHATLHVVLAATHCFDKTITETLIQDNLNPVDKVERSTLIMASTIHQEQVTNLIRDTQYGRVSIAYPQLFLADVAGTMEL